MFKRDNNQENDENYKGVIIKISMDKLNEPFDNSWVINTNVFWGQQATERGQPGDFGAIGALIVVDEYDNIYIERNNIIVRLASK